MTTAFVLALFLIGVVCALAPIVYTVLRLVGKIKPDDGVDAFVLGFFMYVLFWGASSFIFAYLAQLLSLPKPNF